MLINDLIQIEQFGIQSIEPVSSNLTLNNRTIVSKITSQKWQFGLTTTEMREIEFMAFSVELSAQAGMFGEFQLKIPSIGQFNTDKTAVTTSATVAVGLTTIPITTHGLILPGTFIKFGGHTKLYQIRTSTATQLTIYPALTSPLALSESGIIDEPTATVRNTDDMQELRLFEFNRAQAYDLTLEEVI